MAPLVLGRPCWPELWLTTQTAPSSGCLALSSCRSSSGRVSYLTLTCVHCTALHYTVLPCLPYTAFGVFTESIPNITGRAETTMPTNTVCHSSHLSSVRHFVFCVYLTLRGIWGVICSCWWCVCRGAYGARALRHGPRARSLHHLHGRDRLDWLVASGGGLRGGQRGAEDHAGAPQPAGRLWGHQEHQGRERAKYTHTHTHAKTPSISTKTLKVESTRLKCCW